MKSVEAVKAHCIHKEMDPDSRVQNYLVSKTTDFLTLFPTKSICYILETAGRNFQFQMLDIQYSLI
jgi:hypothetical protein